MELRQLRYFLAVARSLNFTRAAAELHIAQPPLSRQIAQLEDELGVLLVDREARPLRLTPAGELFRDHAQDVLGHIERMTADTRRLGQSGQPCFRMGLDAYALLGKFPQLIRRLREVDPRLRIDVRELSARDQIRALKSGEIDVGISRRPSSDPALEQLVLGEDPLVAAIPANHPLAEQAPAPIDLKALSDETFILFSAAQAAQWTLSFLGRRGFQPRNVIETGELQVALGLVAADSGVCLVPAAVEQMRAHDVRYRPLAEPGAASPMVLSYPRERPSPVLPRLLDLLGQPDAWDR
jgi:DNA-binding transcriptional LysR family regulator